MTLPTASLASTTRSEHIARPLVAGDTIVVGAVWLRGVFPEVTSLSTGLDDTVGQKIILQPSQILQRGANGRSGNANKYTEHWVGNGGQSAFGGAMSKGDESVRALVERLKGDVNRQG